jgi:arginine repressor
MNAIEHAKQSLEKLKGTAKFETMLGTASILTNLLDETGLKAITAFVHVYIGNLLLIANEDIGFS